MRIKWRKVEAGRQAGRGEDGCMQHVVHLLCKLVEGRSAVRMGGARRWSGEVCRGCESVGWRWVQSGHKAGCAASARGDTCGAG